MHRGVRTRKEVETDGALDASGRVVAAMSCAIVLLMAAAILARVQRGAAQECSGETRDRSRLVHDDLAALSVLLNLATRSFVGARRVRADRDPALRARRGHYGRLSTDPLAHSPRDQVPPPERSRGEGYRYSAVRP